MNDFGGTVRIESRFPSVNAMGKAGIDKPAPKGVHHVVQGVSTIIEYFRSGKGVSETHIHLPLS